MACHCSIRRWVRGSLIGAGSFGKVNLALDVASGELFAVKSIDCSRRGGSDGANAEIAAMEKELRLLESLDSPFVIRCYGGDETWENGARMKNLFMEYMAGGSLADLMRTFGGALDEDLIRVYTRGIVEGLEYLHGQGIVHCDIKGKNVLIGGTGVKIADLGSAKRVEQQGQTIRGTPLWMAPEVIMQEEQGTPSDIWSLGCTIVEMATGRPPWSHTHLTPLAALMQIGAATHALPPLPDHLSAEVKDFLSKCLQRDPKQRWTAAQLLQHPFLQRHDGNGANGASLCRHHAAAAPVPPLSPTSVLDVSGIADSTSSWGEEGNGRSVPLLHCPELGRLGSEPGERGKGATLASPLSSVEAAAKSERVEEEGNWSPLATPTPSEDGRARWITVRSPRPRGEEKQRPLSDFMLGRTAEVGGDGRGGAGAEAALQKLQFLRAPRRPLMPRMATSSPRHRVDSRQGGILPLSDIQTDR